MSNIPSIDANNSAIIEKYGGVISALSPLGAQVEGIDLSRQEAPATELTKALETEMAKRGFIVFKNKKQISEADFLRVSCWWGGRELHSTHGVHPRTPGGNRHIFRLSNDPAQGIPDVGRNGIMMAALMPIPFPIRAITLFAQRKKVAELSLPIKVQLMRRFRSN